MVVTKSALTCCSCSNFTMVGWGTSHKNRWHNPFSTFDWSSISERATLGWIKPPRVIPVRCMLKLASPETVVGWNMKYKGKQYCINTLQSYLSFWPMNFLHKVEETVPVHESLTGHVLWKHLSATRTLQAHRISPTACHGFRTSGIPFSQRFGRLSTMKGLHQLVHSLPLPCPPVTSGTYTEQTFHYQLAYIWQSRLELVPPILLPQLQPWSVTCKNWQWWEDQPEQLQVECW